MIDLEDEVQKGIHLSRHRNSDYGQEICGSIDESAAILREKLSHILWEIAPIVK